MPMQCALGALGNAESVYPMHRVCSVVNAVSVDTMPRVVRKCGLCTHMQCALGGLWNAESVDTMPRVVSVTNIVSVHPMPRVFSLTNMYVKSIYVTFFKKKFNLLAYSVCIVFDSLIIENICSCVFGVALHDSLIIENIFSCVFGVALIV